MSPAISQNRTFHFSKNLFFSSDLRGIPEALVPKEGGGGESPEFEKTIRVGIGQLRESQEAVFRSAGNGDKVVFSGKGQGYLHPQREYYRTKTNRLTN
jgi:hypothetical protein